MEDTSQHIICDCKVKITMADQGLFIVSSPPPTHGNCCLSAFLSLSVLTGTNAQCLGGHPKVKAKTSPGLYFLKVVVPIGSE